MARNIFRLSNHPLVRWWWGMDRFAFAMVLAIMAIGLVAVSVASIAVADTYDVGPYYFLKRQAVFLCMSLMGMVGLSFIGPMGIKRVGLGIFILALVGVILTHFIGDGVKGAQRWINIAGFSLQPTEFLKPALIVITATLLAHHDAYQRHQGFYVSLLVMGAVAGLVITQPDFSTFMLMGFVWFAQLFISGVSLFWLMGMVIAGGSIALSAYTFLPHVRSRVERFIDPASGDSYQVDQAREAMLSGGLFGRGAGEGVVKHHLPDAHTDFIFAVIGEEFGIVLCLVIVGLYAAFVLRSFSRVLDRQDRFTLIAGSGLLLLLATQAIINVGVVLSLLPTTGMALPFVSYGGSAALGMALTTGFVLSLTRRRGKSGDRRNK